MTAALPESVEDGAEDQPRSVLASPWFWCGGIASLCFFALIAWAVS